MTLRPRHFILLAVVIGLFVVNVIRYRSAQHALKSSTPAPVVTTPAPYTRVNTPAWTAFDQAADQRDAPDAQFLPAMKNLQDIIARTDAKDASIAGVKGCETWLEFYRQGAKHPGPDTSWKERSQRHLDGCVTYHLDTETS